MFHVAENQWALPAKRRRCKVKADASGNATKGEREQMLKVQKEQW